MAYNRNAQIGRAVFQTVGQKPDPDNRPTTLELSCGMRSAQTRIFVSHSKIAVEKDILANASPQSSTKAASNSTSYSRLRWIDSPADHGETEGFHPPKRRRVERAPQQKVRLNAKKPLRIAFAVNEDVWRVILSYCDPKLLLGMRYVSRMFREILKESRIWKESREAHLSTDMPGCPFFLNEAEYTELLDFAHGDTISRQLCPDLFANPQRLGVSHLSYLDLIPTAYHESGKYYAPRRIDSTTGKWYGVSHRTHGLLYLKSDYQKLIQELTVIKREGWELDKVVTWGTHKYNQALMFGKVAEEMLHWETTRIVRWDQIQSRAQSERDREMFFIQKASELPHPILSDLLPFFAAYQSALLTLNKPSERSWQLLLPKILPYREEAEKVKRYQQMQPRCHIRNAEKDWSDDAKLFMKLHDHRHVSHVETGRWTPEQIVIRKLGQQAFCQLDGHVPDDDLVLMCLRTTHDRFEALADKPNGLIYDGTYNTYRLSLDDARMIVEDIIQPELDRKTLRSVTVLRSFRCAGCTRAGVARKFTFRSCFEHIRAVHSIRVGKDLFFSKYARNFVSTMSTEGLSTPTSCSISGSNFPWYIVEWTRTLPILPQYSEINKLTKWDPLSDTPYTPRKMERSEAKTSAFDQRSAVACGLEGVRNFRSALTAAVAAFEPTELNAPCVMKIAFTYALALHSDSPSPTTREEFFEHLKAAKDANARLTFKFRCGLCSRRPTVNKHIRCARTPVEISRLYSHWYQKHKGDGYDLVNDFLDLTPDSELLDVMTKHDQELRGMQMRSHERELVELPKTYRKKPDHKASILMNRPMCMDIFNGLFPITHLDQKRCRNQ